MRYGRSVEEGFLPVFSVDTEEDAETLLSLACSRGYGPTQGEFIANELVREQSLANLQAFSDKLARCWSLIKAKRAQKRA